MVVGTPFTVVYVIEAKIEVVVGTPRFVRDTLTEGVPAEVVVEVNRSVDVTVGLPRWVVRLVVVGEP